MPVVLRVGGFSFGFYSGDHEPPHVHVRYGGGKAVVEIESEETRAIKRLTKAQMAEAVRLVRLYRAELLAAWRESRSKEGTG